MMNSYVIVDLETAGLNLKMDKIMEIEAVKMADGQVVEKFRTTVHPRRQLEEEIVELTGTGDEMLRDAPGIEEIISQAMTFCEGSPLVGHRIMLDYNSLKRAVVNAGLELEKEGVDILELCRKFIPEGERKSLGAARHYFRVEIGTAHRALSDARAANGLCQELMRHHGKDRLETFEPETLIYKVKKEQPTIKRQKEGLRELLKYRRIDIVVQIGHLSRSKVSRMTDKVISKCGGIVKRWVQ